MGTRQLLISMMLAAGFVAGLATASFADEVQASAQTLRATTNGASVDVQFRLTVANNAASVASNVWLTLEGGSQVELGDIEPDHSNTTLPLTINIDASTTTSHAVPLSVTLSFSQDGSSVELTQTVVVSATESAAP